MRLEKHKVWGTSAHFQLLCQSALPHLLPPPTWEWGVSLALLFKQKGYHEETAARTQQRLVLYQRNRRGTTEPCFPLMPRRSPLHPNLQRRRLREKGDETALSQVVRECCFRAPFAMLGRKGRGVRERPQSASFSHGEQESVPQGWGSTNSCPTAVGRKTSSTLRSSNRQSRTNLID